MKSGKKPNKRQAEAMTNNGLNYKEWLVERVLPSNANSVEKLVVVNRQTNEKATIDVL